MSMEDSPMNPVVPPRPEVAYVGVTTRPPISSRSPTGSSVSHTAERETRRRDPPPVPPRDMSLGREAVGGDWEAREDMWNKEMEEVKLRAAQMEKTMRWWSDCTANWREKWSKVRNERNKAREEARQLRAKLETAAKECAQLKRSQQELRKQIESGSTPHSERDRTSVASSGSQKSGDLENQNIDHIPERDSATSQTIPGVDEQTFVDKLLSKQKEEECISPHPEKKKSGRRKEEKDRKKGESKTENDVHDFQKVAVIQVKLDEALKEVHREREEKLHLKKSMDSMDYEMTVLKAKLEDLKKSRDDTQSQLAAIRQSHHEATQDLEDETQERSNMDKRLNDLRKELERIQAENAQEWAKREHLESEKLALERENKKLKAEVENLEEELSRKSRAAHAMVDSDLRTLQTDLSEKTKELSDLRHAHNKTKKQLAEKTTDLEHAMRRSEQYELEVKKLRGRIEDLKHDLADAEDSVDRESNQVRKLQRTNDELQQQVESLQVQVDHLHTRLKRSSQTFCGAVVYDNNESNTEGASEDDEP